MMIWGNGKAMTAKWDGVKLHLNSHARWTRRMEIVMIQRDIEEQAKKSTANGYATGDILAPRANVAPI